MDRGCGVQAGTVSRRRFNVSWASNVGQDLKKRISDLSIMGVRKGTTERRHRNGNVSKGQAQQIPENSGKSE